jgi:hypothetical protein
MAAKKSPSRWKPRLTLCDAPTIASPACYGANEEVFAALYKHSLAPAKDEKDAQYKKGLQIGCLSNTTLPAAQFIFDFPREIIGQQEIFRVLSQAGEAEAAALIQNPSISRLLEPLYRRADMFAQMPEENWCRLVSLSSKNERLVTDKPSQDSPDLDFLRIPCRAIRDDHLWQPLSSSSYDLDLRRRSLGAPPCGVIRT